MEEKGIGRPSTYAPTITTIISHEYVVKEGRYLRPTSLGEVVTGLMAERFPDIVDLKFTANMENGLDEIEKGEKDWKAYLADFYGGFEKEMQAAEKAMEGQRIRVPDEESDEICPNCGKKLVYKSGRFGRFLACPGYPDCSFTMPIVVEMPGKCPACGGRLLKRTSRNGYAYYACERGKDCPWRGNRHGRARDCRLHDLGRAHEGQLPRVRQDALQALRPRQEQALLHKSRLPELPPARAARV